MKKLITNSSVTMNELAKSLHDTTGKKHTIKTTTGYIASHETNQVLYNELFSDKGNYSVDALNMGDYINKASATLAKNIIYSMYCTMFRKIDRENSTDENIVYTWCPGINHDSAKKIVDSGYTDTMYYDIVGEIALYLCENTDLITRGKMVIDWHINDNNSCFDSCFKLAYCYSISRDTYIAIYKVVRKYLYNNSQKQINKEFAVMELETDGVYYEVSARVNSKDYATYLYNEFNNITLSFDGETMNVEKCINEDIERIIDNVAIYVYHGINSNKSKYKIDTIKDVLYSLAKGETMVNNSYGLNRNTYSKYKKAIVDSFSKNDFIKAYYHAVDTVETSDYLHGDSNYNHYEFFDIDKPVITAYYDTELHNKKQRVYNELFGAINDTCIKSINDKYNHDTNAIVTRGKKAIVHDKKAYMDALVNMVTFAINNGVGADYNCMKYINK